MATSTHNDDPKQPLPAPSGMKKIAVPAAVVIFIAVVAWLVIAPMLTPPPPPNPTLHSAVGQRLTYLELRPLTGDGPPVSLADLQDHVTLLNFWGTWCPPCRDELPHLAELQQRFAGQEAFRLLAVSCPAGGQAGDVKSLQEETAALLKSLDLDMPTYDDHDGGTEYALSKIMPLEGFPTTLLLDRQCAIRAVWIGYRPGAETEMERYITKLLDEETGPTENNRADAT